MSNKPVINGKKPLSSKPKQSALNLPDFFKNRLQIPDDIIKDLESKGCEGRWINYRKFVDEGNTHQWGWQLYKRDKVEGVDSFLLGSSPDGIIRRGDCVLAYRQKDYCDAHREYLKERANTLKGYKKAQANELRQMAREGRLDTSVSDDSFDEE